MKNNSVKGKGYAALLILIFCLNSCWNRKIIDKNIINSCKDGNLAIQTTSYKDLNLLYTGCEYVTDLAKFSDILLKVEKFKTIPIFKFYDEGQKVGFRVNFKNKIFSSKVFANGLPFVAESNADYIDIFLNVNGTTKFDVNFYSCTGEIINFTFYAVKLLAEDELAAIDQEPSLLRALIAEGYLDFEKISDIAGKEIGISNKLDFFTTFQTLILENDYDSYFVKLLCYINSGEAFNKFSRETAIAIYNPIYVNSVSPKQQSYKNVLAIMKMADFYGLSLNFNDFLITMYSMLAKGYKVENLDEFLNFVSTAQNVQGLDKEAVLPGMLFLFRLSEGKTAYWDELTSFLAARGIDVKSQLATFSESMNKLPAKENYSQKRLPEQQLLIQDALSKFKDKKDGILRIISQNSVSRTIHSLFISLIKASSLSEISFISAVLKNYLNDQAVKLNSFIFWAEIEELVKDLILADYQKIELKSQLLDIIWDIIKNYNILPEYKYNFDEIILFSASQNPNLLEKIIPKILKIYAVLVVKDVFYNVKHKFYAFDEEPLTLKTFDEKEIQNLLKFTRHVGCASSLFNKNRYYIQYIQGEDIPVASKLLNYELAKNIETITLFGFYLKCANMPMAIDIADFSKLDKNILFLINSIVEPIKLKEKIVSVLKLAFEDEEIISQFYEKQASLF